MHNVGSDGPPEGGIDWPNSDDATVLPPDCMGIVIARDGEVQFCVPKEMDGGANFEMPDAWLAWTEVVLRFMRDPTFADEMLEAFDDRMNEGKRHGAN